MVQASTSDGINPTFNVLKGKAYKTSQTFSNDFLRVQHNKPEIKSFDDALIRIKYLEKTIKYKNEMNKALCNEIAALKETNCLYEQRICMLLAYFDDMGIKIL